MPFAGKTCVWDAHTNSFFAHAGPSTSMVCSVAVLIASITESAKEIFPGFVPIFGQVLVAAGLHMLELNLA